MKFYPSNSNQDGDAFVARLLLHITQESPVKSRKVGFATSFRAQCTYCTVRAQLRKS